MTAEEEMMWPKPGSLRPLSGIPLRRYARRLEEVALLLWGEMPPGPAGWLRVEYPAEVEFLVALHDQVEPPVRLCCMQRHWGVVCADQHFMCCLCFDRFPVAEAYNGEDVCQGCGAAEAGRAVPEEAP